MARWHIIENIVIVAAFAAIVVFAPGGWKWASVALILFVNVNA